MCGIFGVVAGDGNGLGGKQLVDIVKDLFLLSESRGREASGFAGISGDSIVVYKTPFPASEMIKTSQFNRHLQNIALKKTGFFTVIGHSSLVTNGYENFNYNNQPVVKKDMVGVHNRIMVNIDDLWEKYSDEKRETNLDTEIIPVIINKYLTKDNNPGNAVKGLLGEVFGITNIAFLFCRFNNLLMATNNGSVY